MASSNCINYCRKILSTNFLEKDLHYAAILGTAVRSSIKSIMAVFWVILYTAVNLTAVLWLGGLALSALTGWNVLGAMIGLAAFAVVYSLYGGLKAVALTDIIQVVVLVAGGFAITGIVLSLVGDGAGIMAGFSTLMGEIPVTEMILAPENPSYNNLRVSGRCWAAYGFSIFLLGLQPIYHPACSWCRKSS